MPPAARRTTRTRAPRAGTAGNDAASNGAARDVGHGQDMLPLLPVSTHTSFPSSGLAPGHLPGITDPLLCVGIDEAGRGCLAGPVVAAAVILPPHADMADLAVRLPDLAGLTDSKKLTARMREALAPAIRQHAVMWGLGVVWPGDIDRINILQSTFHAMLRAVRALRPGDHATGTGRCGGYGQAEGNGGAGPVRPFTDIDMTELTLVIDGDKTIPEAVFAGLPPTTARTAPPCAAPRQRAVVGGDALVPAVSAASILAKTFRDRLMVALDRRYPGYGLAVHKGYGTAEHCAALELLGPCPVHRTTFRKVRPETGPAQGSLL